MLTMINFISDPSTLRNSRPVCCINEQEVQELDFVNLFSTTFSLFEAISTVKQGN